MAEIWWKGINAEIWVESESRIHTEFNGKFLQGFLRDFPEIPCRILRDFGGFIEDKKFFKILRGILEDCR